MIAAETFTPKFQSDIPIYTPVNINAIKQRLDILGKSALQKSGIKQDAINIEKISSQLGGEDFMQKYTSVLTDILNDISKNNPQLPANFFDINGNSTLNMTELSTKDLEENLDMVISTIRASIKTAFPGNNFTSLHKLMSISNNQDFLSQFSTIVGQHLNDPVWENIGALHGHIEGLSKTYKELIDPKTNKKEVLKRFNSNLKNVWGQVIWENIALIARTKVIDELMQEIGQDIILPTQHTTIGDVSIRVIGKQVGAEKSSSQKQEVADSIVTIQILSKHSFPPTVISEITTADSTKFKQNASTGGFEFKDTAAQTEIHSLGELLASVRRRTYWEKRLSAFLDEPGNNAKGLEQTEIDIENWRNTYEGFYRLALYDTIAVRATTSGLKAQTLTINNKIKMIADVIKDIKQTDIFQRADKDKNNIFQFGGGYKQYVIDQLKISTGRAHNEEKQLQSNYLTYINQVLDTKITISRNVSYAALSGQLT